MVYELHDTINDAGSMKIWAIMERREAVAAVTVLIYVDEREHTANVIVSIDPQLNDAWLSNARDELCQRDQRP